SGAVATDSTAITAAGTQSTVTTTPTTTVAPTIVPGESVPTAAAETTVEPTTTTVPATTTTVDIANLQRRELGALQGQGVDRQPVVRFLNNDRFSQAIQVGDLVATNGGTQSLAPADIVVGRVASVSRARGAAGPTVEVEPAADLRQLNFVRVILYIPPIEEAASAG
ncbi:MAG TPA: rod shape-determining protein MreC, partial [Ilumatobacteraceae bacterium]|nr:rod shape-determining protein MreC [Ilumatobacteraceae bacterium]